MLTKFYRYALLVLSVVTLGFLASCNNEDDPVVPPTIQIRQPSTTATSVTFTLEIKDATSYGYAVVKDEDYKAKNYELTIVNNGETATYTKDNLTTDAFYYIVAVAYNGSLSSEEKALRVRATSPINMPTVEILDFQVGNSFATCILKPSTSATSMAYVFYNDGYKPSPDSWKWFDAIGEKYEKMDFENGNPISQTGLVEGKYVLEAVAYAGNIEGEHVVYPFTVEVVGRTYVSIGISKEGITYKDAQVQLKKNKECKSYYAGLAPKESYDPKAILTMLNEGKAADYHFTDDYSGSLVTLLEKTIGNAWVPETTVVLWVVPCDEDGVYSKEVGLFVSEEITIPKRTLEFGGKGSIEINVTNTEHTGYKAMLKATNCEKYYILASDKATVSADFPTDDELIMNGLLIKAPETKQELTIDKTGLQPDTEYVIYAIGEDSDGKLSKLAKAEIRTLALDYNSAATVSVTATKISYQDITLKFTPSNGCTKVRYTYMTTAEFAQNPDYKGLASRVQNALAMNTASGIQTLNLSGETEVPLRYLNAGTQYLIFTLPIDENEGLGKMPAELPVRTLRFELTGTESVKITRGTITPNAAGGNTVKFTATPTEGCIAYYIQALGKQESEKMTTNELVSKIMDTSSGNTLYYYDEDGGTAPRKTVSMTVFGSAYVYLLCKDNQDKLNLIKVCDTDDPTSFIIN